MTRTTITLTPEADNLVRQAMRERNLSFKDAINTAIVEGLAPRKPLTQIDTPTFDLGRAVLPLERALSLAGELEDEERLRKQELGK